MAKRYKVLLVLSILSMITFLDRIAISSASKPIIADLGLTTVQWGWILGTFTLSYGGFEIPTGLLGDRIGAKKVLVRVVLWWSLFTFFTGLSTGFAMLLVVRFLFGMGEAGAYPNTSIVLSKWFPSVERGRAQAMIWGASRVGAALTPFVVIPIQSHFGWQTSFFVLAFLGVIWTIYWIFWHKEYPEESKDISSAELKLITENRQVETHGKGQKGYLRFAFKHSNLWFLMAMYFCYASGTYFFQSWFHTYLTKGRMMSADSLYWASSLPYLLAAAGCFSGGYISDQACKKWGKKWGRRGVPMIGLAVSGICMILASMTTNNYLAVFALGLGMALMDITAPVAWAVAMDIGGSRSGTISGAMNTAGLTGAYLTTVSFGYLATKLGYNLPVLLLGFAVIIGSILWLKIDATQKIEWKPE
jgi:MFS family permease